MREAKGLPNRDLRRLLRAVHASGNLRDIAIVEVLAGTGLRVGELLALQVGDIEIGERSGKLTVRQGKHGGYRDVPLTREVRAALSAYLEQHPDAKPDTPLWLGTRGELSHRSSVVRLLNKYAYQAGIEAFSPHALRHTFASRYLRRKPGRFTRFGGTVRPCQPQYRDDLHRADAGRFSGADRNGLNWVIKTRNKHI